MRIKSSIKNSIYGILSMVILSVLGFVSTKVLVSTLGIEYNGLNGVFTNIITILSITELGLGGAITYNLYKPIVDKNYSKIASIMHFYKIAYRIIGITIMTLSLIVCTFVPIFLKDTTFDNNYIRFIFLLFAINTSFSYFFSYNRNLFYAYQENYYVVIIDFIFKTIRILAQIFVLYVTKNYVLFLVINIFFTLLANFIIHIIANKKYDKVFDIKIKGNYDKNISKEIFSSVKSLSIVQLLSTSINFTDNLIISSFVSIISSGLYANYSLLFSQITKIITTIFNSIGASIGNLVAENDTNKKQIVFVNLEYISYFIALFCSLCFYFLTEPFITWWLGSKYLLSTFVLIVLVINFYINVNRQVINYFLSASGLFKKMIFPLTIESITNIVISIVLAIKMGIVGVFIGTLVSSIISWIITSKIIYNYNDMKVSKYYLRQVKFIILTIIMIFIISIIFNGFLPSNSILKMGYIVIICFICSLILTSVIIYLVKEIDYIKQLLLKIIKKGERAC